MKKERSVMTERPVKGSEWFKEFYAIGDD